MTAENLEEKFLEFAKFALDETWSDVQGVAVVLAREIAEITK